MRKPRADAYTKEHIEYIRKIGDQTGRTNKEITKMFNEKFQQNRTVQAIIGIKCQNGIRSYTRKYTDEHLDFLRSVSKKGSHRYITQLFNERFQDNRTETSIKSIMHEKGILLADDGRFKKGNRPGNALPVGTEVVREDGYLYVKIEEPNIWKTKHHMIWEEEYGEIPEGHVLLFGDGDQTNIDINNLILISRTQLITLNRYGLIQSDIELTKTGILIADLHQKAGERNRRRKDQEVDYGKGKFSYR